jgi:hypothetical protein
LSLAAITSPRAAKHNAIGAACDGKPGKPRRRGGARFRERPSQKRFGQRNQEVMEARGGEV